MTPQQLKAMKLALEALNSCGHDGDGWDQFYDKDKVKEAITALEETLAEHAMQEVQRLGQEIEPDDIASILACRNMLNAQPVPPRTWVGSGDIENSNAYLTPPQRTEPPQKKVWTFWDLSGGDITDAIKAKLKEKNQ